MTHDQKGLESQRDGPEPSDESSAPLYSVSAVFGETELRQMSGVLDAVCEKLNIGRNSPDARAAALAILAAGSLAGIGSPAPSQAAQADGAGMYIMVNNVSAGPV